MCCIVLKHDHSRLETLNRIGALETVVNSLNHPYYKWRSSPKKQHKNVFDGHCQNNLNCVTLVTYSYLIPKLKCSLTLQPFLGRLIARPFYKQRDIIDKWSPTCGIANGIQKRNTNWYNTSTLTLLSHILKGKTFNALMPYRTRTDTIWSQMSIKNKKSQLVQKVISIWVELFTYWKGQNSSSADTTNKIE